MTENFPSLRWITRRTGVRSLIASSAWPNLGEPRRQVRMMPKASQHAQSISASPVGRACSGFRLQNAYDRLARVRASRLPLVCSPRRLDDASPERAWDGARRPACPASAIPCACQTCLPSGRLFMRVAGQRISGKLTHLTEGATRTDPSRVSRRAAQICRGKSASTV